MSDGPVYEDTLNLPSEDLDIYIAKDVEGQCSLTESTLENESLTLIGDISTGFIFISDTFIESDQDPRNLARYRDVESDDDDDENIVENSRTTLGKFSEISEDDDRDKPERVYCKFCRYKTRDFLRCTVFEVKPPIVDKEERLDLLTKNTSKRMSNHRLHLCTHCVSQLRGKSAELLDGLEVTLAVNNI